MGLIKADQMLDAETAIAFAHNAGLIRGRSIQLRLQ